jgi:phosphoribosyl-AMP cyclohydrolase
MEHPLISNIDHLTVDELHTKITELTKKIGIAHRMGNAHLRHQIEMALATYQSRYREKQQELWNQGKNSGTDFGDKIDIS